MSSTTEQGNATPYAAAWVGDDPASSLRLALDVLEGNSVRQAEPLLRWALGHLPETVVLSGQTDYVTSASFSPDGRFVLTACLDHVVRVFEAATGEQRASFDIGAAPRFQSGRPEFSSDGTLLIVPGFDGRLHIGPWEGAAPLPVLPVSLDVGVSRAALTRDNINVITGHIDGTVRVSPLSTPGQVVPLAGTPGDPIACVAVSPNGRYTAAGTRTGDIRLWDLTTPGQPVVVPAHKGWVNTVEFSFDNRLLVSSSDDATARLFAVPDGRLVAELDTNTDRVNAARFSHNGELVVTASVDKTARVFDTRIGAERAVMQGVADEVQSAEFSPDDSLVAMASVDGTVRICYTRNGSTLFELTDHKGAVFTVAFDPAGTRVVTASADQTARLWDVNIGHVFGGHTAEVNTAVFSRDGTHVATACEDGVARVFETAGDSPVALVADHEGGGVNSAAFNNDGTFLVTAGQDRTARVTAWQTAAAPVVLPHDLEVDAALFTFDGNEVITCTRHEVALWNWRAGQRVTTFAPPPDEQAANPFIAIIGVDISPDNRTVVTAHYDQKARLWDAATGAQVHSLEHAGVVYTAVFSDDGGRVVTASGGDGHVRLWDAQTGALLRTLVGPSRQLRCAALSRDAQWAAAGDAEGNVTIWSVINEQVAAVRRLHAALIMSVVFSPDSTAIATASDDGTAKSVAVGSFQPLDELVPIASQRVRLATA